MAALSEATAELQNALDLVISYQPNTSQTGTIIAGRIRRSSSSLPNTYERKRALRRVDRAVTSLEEALLNSPTRMEDDSNPPKSYCIDVDDDTGDDNGIIDDDEEKEKDEDEDAREEFKIRGGTLDTSVLELLMDVITELPKVILLGLGNRKNGSSCISATVAGRDPVIRSSITGGRNAVHSSSNLSNTPSDSNNMNALLLQDLYDQTANTACRIFGNHGALPLDPSHIDRLLDQIASMVISSPPSSSSSSSRAKIHCGIVGIINSSLDVAVNQIPAQQQSEDNDQVPLFLLNAIETLKLTQILIPLSLNHLSHSWIFHPADYYDNGHGGGIGRNGGDGVSDEEQESEVQLRLLLGNLFRHFSSLLSPNQLGHSNEDDGNDDDNIDDINGSSNIVSFEDTLYRVFQEDYRNTNCSNQNSASSIPSTRQEYDVDNGNVASLTRQPHNRHSISHQEMMVAIEDYIDLASSFLIENVEYAVDVIDTSSHHLRKIGNTARQCNTNAHGTTTSSTTKDIDYASPDDTIQYLKGVILHTSIAIGMVETFRDGLGLYLSDTNSSNDNANDSDAHLGNLWNAFANFVSMFSENDTTLNGSRAGGAYHQRRQGREDIQLLGSLLDSADNDLFRLHRLMSGTNMMVESELSTGTLGSNTPDKRNCTQMMTFLRAYHWVSNQYHRPSLDSNNSAVVFEDILENISTGLRSMVTKNDSKIADSINMATKDGQSRIKEGRKRGQLLSNIEDTVVSEETNMLQACALSTLILPDHTIPGISDQNNETGINEEVHILAALVNPLLSTDIDISPRACKKMKGSHIVPMLTDPLNPWHFLLSKKISETLPWIEYCESVIHTETNNNNPQLPRNVAASSVSTVSDLSLAHMGTNTNATDAYSKSSASDSDYNGADTMTLKSYLQAVNPSAHKNID